MVIRFCILLLLQLCLQLTTAGQVLAANLTTSVDRNVLKEGETLALKVRLNGKRTNSGLDVAPLEQDFQIDQSPQQSSRQSFTVIDGRRRSSSYTEYTLSLLPKRTGHLVIPSLDLDGFTSRPIQIRVLPLSIQERQTRNQTAFFITEVDAPEIYVRSQLIYTVKLYYAARTENGLLPVSVNGSFPPPPQLKDAVIESFGTARRYHANRNQRRYLVHERRYLIFPQSSGELQLPPEQTYIRWGQPGRPSSRLSVISSGHKIRVKPRPASYPAGAEWLPARNLRLEETFDRTPPGFRVGESVSRTLRLRAEGIVGSGLPPLPALTLDDAKTYADPAVIDEEFTETGIRSARLEVTGIVPTGGQLLRFPEVSVHWWDLETDSLQVALLPGRQYPVTGAPEAVRAPVRTAPPIEVQEEPGAAGFNWLPWLLASHLLLLCGWLASSLYYRQRLTREKSAAAPAESPVPVSAAEALQKLSATEDPAVFRNRLLEWSRLYWNQRHSSLADVARAFRDPELSQLLAGLELGLYGQYRTGEVQSAPPDCKKILQRLKKLSRKEAPAAAHGLAALNPA